MVYRSLKKWRDFGIAHAFPDANNIIRHADVDLVVVLKIFTCCDCHANQSRVLRGRRYREWPQLGFRSEYTATDYLRIGANRLAQGWVLIAIAPKYTSV
ncbi:MAG: hypothetical protein WBQ89_23725 [Candidatus Acidiferrum sp.]